MGQGHIEADQVRAVARRGTAGVDERVVLVAMEIPPNYGSRYTEAFRESFIVVAQSTGATLGSFPLQDVATDPQLMQADGIHPTVEAQAIIAARVLPEVREALATP